MKFFRSKYLWIGSFFTMTIVCVVFGLTAYNRSLYEQLNRSACDTISEILNQQKFNFDSEMEAELITIELLALTIGSLLTGEENECFVDNPVLRQSEFEHLIYVNRDGKGCTTGGGSVDLSDRDYFQKAMNRETNIGAPIPSKIEDKIVVPVATPVYREGKISGVLVGTYTADRMSKLILPSFGGRGYAFIVDPSGEIITDSRNGDTLTTEKNLFTYWKSARFVKHDSLDTILQNVSEGAGGHTAYQIGNETRMCHYAPLNYNGWYIFVAVSQSVISANANRITRQAAVLTFSVVILSFFFIAYILILQTRTDRKQRDYLTKLESIAYYDQLTGLPTLANLKRRAQQNLKDYPKKRFLLVKFDVSKFKLVNQLYGFSVGNRLLREISESLKQNMKSECDCCAKVNTDEFIVFHEILDREEFDENRTRFIDRLMQSMGAGFSFNLKLPAGHYVIEADNGDRDINDALEKVNFAHREAKRTGQEVCVYTSELAVQAIRQQVIENRMDEALEQEEFVLYLQPKYSLKHGSLAGAEVLVRWAADDPSLFNPGNFIPVFEKNGFITKLDFYMFEKTCKLMNGWIAAGLEPITVSVNFSRLHLDHPDFVTRLCSVADQYGIERHLLEIELTESSILENESQLLMVLKDIHRAGFTCSMDDFGSGYSSLGLLKDVPVDVIKIDRAFFDTVHTTDRAVTVIANVMHMARELGIRTVAEGVELSEQMELLKTLDCDMVQGYYFDRPMPEAEFRKKLNRTD